MIFLLCMFVPVHVLIVCAFWGFPALWTQHHTGHRRTSPPRAPSICACNISHEKICLSKSWQEIYEWRGASIYIQYEGSEGLITTAECSKVAYFGPGKCLCSFEFKNFCFLRFEGFCNCQDSLIEVSLGRELGSAMLAGEADAFVLAQLMPVHICLFTIFTFVSAHAFYAFVCLA